uniref:Uncharacterized protein n=1 Tax=Marseillevirus LCMAC102 TaxID=2506603 RepID=A0A481YV93_9VIRU|nr:MAG: hypothetical protein LCMAC102_02110 [Marseillevirus LCMAC102]
MFDPSSFNEIPTVIIIKGLHNEKLNDQIKKLQKKTVDYEFDVKIKNNVTWIKTTFKGILPYKWLDGIVSKYKNDKREFSLIMAYYDLGMDIYDVHFIKINKDHKIKMHIQETGIEYTNNQEAQQKAEDNFENSPPVGDFLTFLKKYDLLTNYMSFT